MGRTVETKYVLTGKDKTKNAFKSMQGNLKKTNSNFNGVLGSLGKLGPAMAPLAAIGSIAGIVKIGTDSIKSADHVNKMATALNISTEALSQYQHAAKLSGIEQTQMEAAFRTMNQRIAESAMGMGEAKKFLDQLGLSAKAMNELNADEKFLVLSQALAEVENASDRAAIAGKLFGEEVGAKLLPMINDGAAGIRKMKDEADALGATLSKDAADDASDAVDAMTRLETAFASFARNLTTSIAPAITDALNWINDSVFGTEEEQKVKKAAKTLKEEMAAVDKEYRAMGLHEEWQIRVPKPTGHRGLIMWVTETRKEWQDYIEMVARARIAEREALAQSTGAVEDDPVVKMLNNREEAAKKTSIAMGMPISGSFGGTQPSSTAGDEDMPDPFGRMLDNQAEKLLLVQDELNKTALAQSQMVAMNSALADSFANLAAGGIDIVSDAMGQLIESWLSAEKPIIMIGSAIKKMVASVIADLMRMILRAILANVLLSALGLTGANLSGIKKIMQGSIMSMGGLEGRASGGPVSAHQPYIVGERGPELFTPTVSGSITPNEQLGGQATITNNISLTVEGVTLDDPIVLKRTTDKLVKAIAKEQETYFESTAVA